LQTGIADGIAEQSKHGKRQHQIIEAKTHETVIP
jgi:hypothetical protein